MRDALDCSLLQSKTALIRVLQLAGFRSAERTALLPNHTDRCAMDLVGLAGNVRALLTTQTRHNES